MINEKLYIERLTSKELTETKAGNIETLINILENDNPDSSYFLDVNLSALLDYLHEAGYNDDDIVILNNNNYGNFIRFYHLIDYKIHIMEIGAC